MARNTERDEREIQRLKNRLMEAGFHLFSRYGIEAVSLQRVADTADVGAATMYKYFQTKTKLVVAISGKVWGEVWREALKKCGTDGFASSTAHQAIAFYVDLIIGLYQKRPELLRFSSDYKTYICHECATVDELKVHLDVLEPVRLVLHQLYERAQTDRSIRIDLSEQRLFTTVAITMLSVAEQYAQGIVWVDDHKEDHTRELTFVKNMLLTWCAGKVS